LVWVEMKGKDGGEDERIEDEDKEIERFNRKLKMDGWNRPWNTTFLLDAYFQGLG